MDIKDIHDHTRVLRTEDGVAGGQRVGSRGQDLCHTSPGRTRHPVDLPAGN